MTREEKLQAMAREWCAINGWQPDHRPKGLRSTGVFLRPGGRPTGSFEEYDEEPIWTRHVAAMDRLLKAIGE